MSLQDDQGLVITYFVQSINIVVSFFFPIRHLYTSFPSGQSSLDYQFLASFVFSGTSASSAKECTAFPFPSLPHTMYGQSPPPGSHVLYSMPSASLPGFYPNLNSGGASPPGAYNNYTAVDPNGRRSSVHETNNIWASPSTNRQRRFSVDFSILAPERGPSVHSDPFSVPLAARTTNIPASAAFPQSSFFATPSERWDMQRRTREQPAAHPGGLLGEPNFLPHIEPGELLAPPEFRGRHSTGDIFGPRQHPMGWNRPSWAAELHHGISESSDRPVDPTRVDYAPEYAPEQSLLQAAHAKEKAKEPYQIPPAVLEYFSADPHNRVKVTAEYLEKRFFDEEKYLDSLYQLPKFPLGSASHEHQLVLVAFKAGRVDVFHLPEHPNLKSLQVGDLVIVEADRGKDLGRIVKFNVSIDEAHLLKLLEYLVQQAALNEHSLDDLSVKLLHHMGGHGPHQNHAAGCAPPTLHAPKAILALAQQSEIQQILNKKQDEEKACRLCLSKIANATSSQDEVLLASSELKNMRLVDAEYQFDRRKLIFYYSTTKRIDFRDLVRELFRIYKTRIWMCAVSGTPYSARKARRQNKGLSHNEEKNNSVPGLENNDVGRFPEFGASHNGAKVNVPREFHAIRELSSSDDMALDGGESLVLKSLVDTLDR